MFNKICNYIINKMHILTHLNKQIISFLEIPAVQYTFLAIIVLRVIAMGQLSDWYLSVYDYTWFRVLMGLMIAYTAIFDPIYSIALATLMILSIQELHRRRATVKMPTMTTLPNNIIGEHKNILNELPTKDIVMNNEMVFNEINKHSLQKSPTGDDSISAEYDYYFDPAFKTLTQTVAEQNTLRNGSFYVTTDELKVAQNNEVGNNNQNMPVTAFTNSLNAQGIPNGFDKTNYYLDSKVLEM